MGEKDQSIGNADWSVNHSEPTFKKSPELVGLRPRERYIIAQRFLEENKTLPINLVCDALELSRSSFYAARKAKTKNDLLDWEVWKNIQEWWCTFPGIGYRKLSAYLKINKKRILRILNKYRKNKGESKGKKEGKGTGKGSGTTQPKPIRLNLIKIITKELVAHPDKLARGNWVLKDGKNGYRKLIEPTRPYQLWASDWKEFKLKSLGITVYIFAVIDVYTRQLKGYSFSLTKDVQAAMATNHMAVDNSQEDHLFDPRKLTVHSDRGGAYVADENVDYWKGMGVSQSFADPGKPTQNPYIEAFFSILKRFWLDQHDLTMGTQVETSLTRFFNLYNREWKHSSINYQTPDERLESYRSAVDHIC